MEPSTTDEQESACAPSQGRLSRSVLVVPSVQADWFGHSGPETFIYARDGARLLHWAYWSSCVGRRMSGERRLGLPVQRARFRPAPPDVPSRCPLSGNRRSRPERHQ